MKTFFLLTSSLLFCMLFLSPRFASAQSTEELLMKSAVLKLQNAREYTLAVAEAMPAEKYVFTPVAGEMNFKEQLLHLCDNLRWLTGEYISRADSSTGVLGNGLTGKDSVIKVIGQTYDYAINNLQDLDVRKLTDTVKFFVGPMTRLQVLTLENDHQTHHRGQLIVYLRLNGIKPPGYVGW